MVINKSAFEQIKREKENLLPTPPKTTAVIWYDRNQKTHSYAAIVTEQQGPGKVEIIVFKPRGVPMHKQGVLHISHPVHQKRADSATIRNGSWEYPPNVKPHRSHFEIHLKEIERRENHLLKSEQQAIDAKRSRDSIRESVELQEEPSAK